MACFCNCEFERYPQGWHEECHCVKPKGWPCPSDVSDEEAEKLNEDVYTYDDWLADNEDWLRDPDR